VKKEKGGDKNTAVLKIRDMARRERGERSSSYSSGGTIHSRTEGPGQQKKGKGIHILR